MLKRLLKVIFGVILTSLILMPLSITFGSGIAIVVFILGLTYVIEG